MPNLLRAIIGRLARFQTSTITAEQLHDEFFAHCSPNCPELRAINRVVPNYWYNWWKDRFDWLGLDLPVLNIHEVMEMTQDHFEQLVSYCSLSHAGLALIVIVSRWEPCLCLVLW